MAIYIINQTIKCEICVRFISFYLKQKTSPYKIKLIFFMTLLSFESNSPESINFPNMDLINELDMRETH